MIGVKRLLLLLAITCFISFALAGTHPGVGTCFRNCTQCKKFIGIYFDLQLCNEYCVKFKGKFIPDVDDVETLRPFIYKLDEDQ